MTKLQLMVLYGGVSSEHDVSLLSAANVAKVIDRQKYDIRYVKIDRAGRWYETDTVIAEGIRGIKVEPSFGGNGFLINDELYRPDVIFAVLHGKNGEDGSVQGLAQLLDIPIVGCDMTASVLGMDKLAAKRIVGSAGVPIVPYMVFKRGDQPPTYAAIATRLGPTVFIKPVRAGSSVGVNKAVDQISLDGAIAAALEHDDTVLIETAIAARELEVAVLGNYPAIEASAVGEIIPDGDFYSYEAKYDDSSTSAAVIPADITIETTSTIRQYAVKVFDSLGGSGLARVDFFLSKTDDAIYFNEINTLPGFTDISMYPKLWAHNGLAYSQLIDRLIGLARQTAGSTILKPESGE